jgi:hypothetical protein
LIDLTALVLPSPPMTMSLSLPAARAASTASSATSATLSRQIGYVIMQRVAASG